MGEVKERKVVFDDVTKGDSHLCRINLVFNRERNQRLNQRWTIGEQQVNNAHVFTVHGALQWKTILCVAHIEGATG